MKISTTRSYISRGHHPLKKKEADLSGRWRKKSQLSTKEPARAATLSRPREGNQPKRSNHPATRSRLEGALRKANPRGCNRQEAVERAEELARKQQAILDKAERREKDKQENLNGKAPTLADNDSKIAESKDQTWKPSTVVTKIPGREKGK
ncbi:hypothetical protein PIB30_082630 [Stylosanthes scabra]|uniref:Uncharacterized protein n=1 Tax=Stylosanthes scabra TaxID=79078 RepID=A0ABU6WTN0_9FABA|nr:hypothetical protein [Stylosanthes scabra]